MATLTKNAARQDQQLAAGQDRQIVLHGVSWETYEGLLCSYESQHGSIRMSYDRGRLVLMSPSRPHEIDANRLGLIIQLTAAGLGLNCLGVRQTTLKSEEAGRGKEPDTAFYIANEPRVRGKRDEMLDLRIDPPPDLVVEVEITHSDPAMLSIYAALRVPEVWHYDGRRLRVLQLQADGRYTEVAESPSLPSLPLKEIPRWLEWAETEGESVMILAFLDWVRNELAPASKPKRKRGKKT